MSEDRTIDGAAVDEAARGAAEANPTAAPAEAPGDGAASADDGETTYHRALDSYMNGDLQGVVKLVDGVLEQKPGAGLKSRLERLRRRATDRMAREGIAVDGGAAAPAGDAPAGSDSAAGATGGGNGNGDGGATATEAGAASTAATSTETATADPAPAVAETSAASAAAAGSTAVSAAASAVAEAAAAEASAAPAVTSTPATPAADGTEADKARGEVDKDATSPLPVKRGGPRPSGPSPAPTAPPRRPASGVQTALPPPKPAAPGAPVGAAPATRPPQKAAPVVSPGMLKGEMDRVVGELDKLRRTVSGIEDHILKVAEAYAKLSKDGKRKDQAYDQLYEELRQYKSNFLLQAQKPLLLDIILLFDGVSRTMASFSDLPDEKVTRQMVLDALAHTRDEVLEVLYRRDIERITDTPSKLNVEFQKPVSRVDTDKVDEDRDIVQVVREGFRQKDVVLRPQEVIVKRSTKEREPQ